MTDERSEPRLRLDDPDAQPECFFCGKRLDKRHRGTYSCSEGLQPTLWFHGSCGSGLTGEHIRAVYLKTLNRMFRTGGDPLLLD